MTTQEFITLIIAVWGAVLATAIFILNRVAKTPRLRVSIADMVAYDMWDNTTPNENIVLISITNVGAIEVLVKTIWFQSTEGKIMARLFKKCRKNYFWKCSEVLGNLPKVVEPRREIHFCVPADKFHTNTIKNMKTLKHVHLVVTDSTGRNYCSSPLAKTFKQRETEPEKKSET